MLIDPQPSDLPVPKAGEAHPDRFTIVMEQRPARVLVARLSEPLDLAARAHPRQAMTRGWPRPPAGWSWTSASPPCCPFRGVGLLEHPHRQARQRDVHLILVGAAHRRVDVPFRLSGLLPRSTPRFP